MDRHAIGEIERPRSVVGLIGATFRLYLAFPWLFLALAAVVVIPDVAIRAAVSELPENATRGLLEFALGIADFALFLPLVAALHVFAVDDLKRGGEPGFASVIRRGGGRLRTVSAAAFLSWLGISLGFVALIIPGIVLSLWWAVVAQSAALGEGDWRDALDQSRVLTEDRWGHVFVLLLLVALMVAIPGVLVSLVLGFGSSLTGALIRLPIDVATTSFGALAAALLYFDLSARSRGMLAKAPPADPVGVAPTDHPLDPDS